jgi:hypothetical protein
MKRITTDHASPAYVEAFRTIVNRIETSLAGAQLNEPVKMYVAGGAALHFYTGRRISEDIDAVFSKRLLLPQDLDVNYRDVDGSPRLLYFDRQYNDTLGLMHENADLESVLLRLPGVDPAVVEVRLLSPADLAVSKLAGFGETDQEDIRSLAEEGLLDLQDFRERAEDALTAYIGDRSAVQLAIEKACEIIKKATPRAAPK